MKLRVFILLVYSLFSGSYNAQNNCTSPVLISDGSCISFNISIAGASILTGCNGGLNPRAYVRFTAPSNGECVQFDFSGFTTGGTYQLSTYTIGCASYVTNSGACVENVLVGQPFSYSGKSALGANLYLPGGNYIMCIQSDNPTPMTVCMSTPDAYEASDQCAGAINVGLAPVTLYNGGDCRFSGSLDNPSSNDPASTEICAGSLENSQWTSFVADATSIQITGSNVSCTGGGCGFQFGIFKGACGSLTNLGCYGQKVCTGGQSVSGPTNPLGQVTWTGLSTAGFTATIGGLTPGETVYLVMDGNADADCKYTLAGVNVLALPVELSSFTASVENRNVELNWSTASEAGNAYFSIERSDADGTFSEIARVSGSYYSSEESQYKYLDNDLLPGVYYYRLKQVDFDGKETYSFTISARVALQDRVVVKRIGLRGEDVTNSFQGEGIIIEIYDDGTARKVYYSHQ